MTTVPLFHYDADQHAHVAEWEDCIFTGTAPARDPRGDFYIDLRATLIDGVLLNYKRLRILDPWACKAFAQACDDQRPAQEKIEQYLTLFADWVVTVVEQPPLPIPDGAAPPLDTGPHAVLIVASDVQEEAMFYLWEPYIPRKMATILDGDPGSGKTGLACLLAAGISKGYPMPDQAGKPTQTRAAPGAVLMVAMEDNLGAVIIPRLNRLGADLTRITFVNECQDLAGNPRPFTLGDLPLLTAYMEQMQPDLVYIDAIQAVLGGKIDINRANAVTAILGPLKKLAEEYGCAVVCSRHPAKPGQQIAKVLYRGMGSQAFVGTVRSGLFVEEHPDDESQSLLVHYKSNTGGLGVTHIFSKARGHFTWGGVTRITHTMLAGSGGPGPSPTERLKACLWLEQKLSHGQSLPASGLYEVALAERGFSSKLLRAASDYLKIIKTQIPSDFLWKLPPLRSFEREERESSERIGVYHISGVSEVSEVSEVSGVSSVSGVDSENIEVRDTYYETSSPIEEKKISVSDVRIPLPPSLPQIPPLPDASRVCDAPASRAEGLQPARDIYNGRAREAHPPCQWCGGAPPHVESRQGDGSTLLHCQACRKIITVW